MDEQKTNLVKASVDRLKVKATNNWDSVVTSIVLTGIRRMSIIQTRVTHMDLRPSPILHQFFSPHRICMVRKIIPNQNRQFYRSISMALIHMVYNTKK